MVTHIVVPVRDRVDLTQNLAEQLESQDGWEKCWIFDNGSKDDTWNYLISLNKKDARFFPVNADNIGIYDMWSEGYKRAREEQANFVAILNNDLLLAPNTISILRTGLIVNKKAWISYPDYNNLTFMNPISYKITKGTYRHGGMSGFCFMLKTESIDWEPLVDSQFKWWGGDDDIAFEVEKREGQQIRILGLPVTHLMEGTARHYDLGEQKAMDLQAVLKKWGR